MNRVRKQRVVCLSLLLFSVTVAIVLMLLALSENINHFYTPSQIQQGLAVKNVQIRGGGMIVVGSVKRDKEGLNVQFQIGDGDAVVDVVYEGILPDLFVEGSGIVATGIVNDQGVFIARELLARHSPDYMPAEVKMAIDEVHRNKRQSSAVGIANL